MPFTLRPLPGSSNVVTDATDFAALSDASQAEHHDLWDFDSTSVLYIHAYNTPLAQCPGHSLAESLLLRSFKPTPEVLHKHVGKFFVAPYRLGGALLRLVDAGLDLDFGNVGHLFPRQNGPLEKKDHLESGLDQRNEAKSAFLCMQTPTEARTHPATGGVQNKFFLAALRRIVPSTDTPSTRMEIRTWRSAIADLKGSPPGAP